MNEEAKRLRLIAKHLTQEQISMVPESNWYQYSLHCGHIVYSRKRLKMPKSYNEHYIRCPQCQRQQQSPLNWQPVIAMKAVTDEHVSNVLDGTSFIVPKRILRTDGHTDDGHTIPSGNPFPYASKEDEY